MPIRVCKKQIQYPVGKERNPGDEFEVEEKDVNTLVVTGFIERDAPHPAQEVEYLEDPPDSHEEINGTLHAKRGKGRQAEQRAQSAARNQPRQPETL